MNLFEIEQQYTWFLNQDASANQSWCMEEFEEDFDLDINFDKLTSE